MNFSESIEHGCFYSKTPREAPFHEIRGKQHCVKSVRIRSYSGPAFGLNTERDTEYLSVFSPNTEKYGPE